MAKLSRLRMTPARTSMCGRSPARTHVKCVSEFPGSPIHRCEQTGRPNGDRGYGACAIFSVGQRTCGIRLSIFYKNCPECTAVQPTQATACNCGYCFEPKKLNDPHLAAEYALQQEKLYQDYLAARVAQAQAAAKTASIDAAADPENTLKAAQALRAHQTFLAAEAELTAQVARTKRLLDTPHAKLEKTAVERKPESPPVNVGAPVVVPTIATPTTVSPPPVSAKPGVPFKALQSAKAKNLLPRRAPKKIVTRTEATKAIAPKPTQANVEPPAVVAAPTPAVETPRVASAAPLKECPNCSAKVPIATVRCRCGFDVSTPGIGVPALALDARTRAILADTHPVAIIKRG